MTKLDLPRRASGVLALSFILFVIKLVFAVEDKKIFTAEPAFPHVIDSEQLSQRSIRIVSESVSEDSGYETHEEYADFLIGKDVFVVTSKTGHQVTYIDSQADLIYQYKPYSCRALQPDEVEATGGYQGLWHAQIKFTVSTEEKLMRLYGVAALWWNAGRMTKTYEPSQVVYSASKSIYRPSHKWSIRDDDTNTMVHMFFIDPVSSSSNKAPRKLTLESIQIQRLTDLKTIRTINILAMDSTISQEIYNNLLQVPVGYGCTSAEVTKKAKVQFPTVSDVYKYGALLSNSHKIQMEVTATKFGAPGKRAQSDTISVELARNFNQELQLIRQRDTRRDLKTIVNSPYKVKYEVDLRRGTCEMSHVGSEDGLREEVYLKFNNGLELDIDTWMMDELFLEDENFFFTKRTDAGSEAFEHIFFEQQNSLPKDSRPFTVVRLYAIDSASDSQARLKRVTIWIFDQQKTEITESYQFNLIETRDLKSRIEMARVFDISEECYLNNEKMRQNRDYAWIELHYPVTTRHIGPLSRMGNLLKANIYENYAIRGLNFFRMPRVELMFEDDGFVLRALLIDIPPMILIASPREETLLSIDKQDGDLEELAPDLNHCVDLCRLNHCKSMTYCPAGHLCLLTTRPATLDITEKSSEKRLLVNNKACTSYLLPPSDDLWLGGTNKWSLKRLLNDIQHADYGAVSLPAMPEELSGPRSETDIDDKTYSEMTLKYMAELSDYLHKEGHRVPMLTSKMNINGALLVLLPDRFEIEQDPLNEFSLGDESAESSSDDQSDDRVPPFHEGLSLQRYKMSGLSQIPDGPTKPIAKLFSGLNYDQCSLACVDSKCSSFSYCFHRQECIITSIYDISKYAGTPSIEQDAECFIAQRDFLSKFDRFQGVYRPNVYQSKKQAYNPSECAHSCWAERDFKCLAFDYCAASGTDKMGTCFNLEDRFVYNAVADIDASANAKSSSSSAGSGPKQPKETMCDHYSRSYLADFVRVEYRRIKDTELAKLKVSDLVGKTVDQCADACINEMVDCTAFQFCFDPNSKTTKQSCTMIESKPETENKSDNEVVIDGKAEDGNVVKAGKMFAPSNFCHVFSLRRDSQAASMRDLAVNSLDKGELESNKKNENQSGLSIKGGIFLYVCLTLVFAAVGCGITLAREHNGYLREKVDRVRLLIGV